MKIAYFRFQYMGVACVLKEKKYYIRAILGGNSFLNHIVAYFDLDGLFIR
jgi:hypothetical protein